MKCRGDDVFGSDIGAGSGVLLAQAKRLDWGAFEKMPHKVDKHQAEQGHDCHLNENTAADEAKSRSVTVLGI